MSFRSKKRGRPFHFYLGNFLIISSVFLLFFTYYPFIKLYLQLPSSGNLLVAEDGFYLIIPKIQAKAPIIANTDPFNKEEYLVALQNGVAHAKDTALPEEKGTIFLFAHSSDAPWRITRYNTIFFRLGELEVGDNIIILKDKKTYQYTVTGKKEVWPNEVQHLKDNQTNQLILMTCVPVGTSLKRLLIFAKPL